MKPPARERLSDGDGASSPTEEFTDWPKAIDSVADHFENSK
jgi:hypothetical protein